MVTAWPRRRVAPEHAYPIPGAERRIVLEVLNGTTRPGLARAGTRLLRRRGLDVVYFGNADTLLDSSRVVVRRGEGKEAREVAEVLGIGRIVTELDTLRRVDYTVLLGRDFAPPAELHP